MPSRQTAISDHILGNNIKRIEPCVEYNRELKKACGRNPTPKNKLAFLKYCFTLSKIV